jgi:hypothetical protein
MAKDRDTKRPREEESGESDSDLILELSNDDDSQEKPKVKKKVKLEGSTSVRNAAVRKLSSAPKGSIGIPAVRALLAQSGSTPTWFMDASKETNIGLRKAGRVPSVGSGGRKTSKKKRKEPEVKLVFLFSPLLVAY